MYQNKLSNLTAFFKFFCYCLFCFEDEPKTGKWWYLAKMGWPMANGSAQDCGKEVRWSSGLWPSL